jgi:hypothetical protein
MDNRETRLRFRRELVRPVQRGMAPLGQVNRAEDVPEFGILMTQRKFGMGVGPHRAPRVTQDLKSHRSQ